MSSRKTIARNTIFLYFRMLVVMAVSLYTVRVVLHALGATDYGIYNVAAGMVTLFTFINGAMSQGAQRFLSIDIGRNDDAALGKTFNTILALHTSIAIIVIMLCESVGLWFLNHKLNIPANRLAAANVVYHFSIAASAFTILQTPYNALIISREKMWFFSFVSIVEALLKLGIAYLVSSSTHDRLPLYAMLACLAVLVQLAFYIGFCLSRFRESHIQLHGDWSVYRQLANFAGWNLLGNAAGAGRTQGVNVLINIFFGPSANAAYAVMMQAQSAVNTFANSFQLALNPQIYQHYAKNNLRQMHSLISGGSRLSFVLVLALITPAIHSMDYLLHLWLGHPPQYSAVFVEGILAILSVESLSQPLMTAAAATGNIMWYQLIIGGSLLLIVPFSYIAFRCTGNPVSFIYVTMLVSLVSLFQRLQFLKKMVTLNVFTFLRTTLLPAALLSIASLLFLHALDMFAGKPNDFVQFVFQSISITVFVILAALVICLGKDERAAVFQAISKRIQSKN